MKGKLYTKSSIVFLALFSFLISSCKKLELDANRPPAVNDTQAPSISNVLISNMAAVKGDSIDIKFTAKDDNGLYFVKIDYEPWNLVRSATLDGTMKEYTYETRIKIPTNAMIQSHSLKLAALGIAFKEVSSSAAVNVVR